MSKKTKLLLSFDDEMADNPMAASEPVLSFAELKKQQKESKKSSKPQCTTAVAPLATEKAQDLPSAPPSLPPSAFVPAPSPAQPLQAPSAPPVTQPVRSAETTQPSYVATNRMLFNKRGPKDVNSNVLRAQVQLQNFAVVKIVDSVLSDTVKAHEKLQMEKMLQDEAAVKQAQLDAAQDARRQQEAEASEEELGVQDTPRNFASMGRGHLPGHGGPSRLFNDEHGSEQDDDRDENSVVSTHSSRHARHVEDCFSDSSHRGHHDPTSSHRDHDVRHRESKSSRREHDRHHHAHSADDKEARSRRHDDEDSDKSRPRHRQHDRRDEDREREHRHRDRDRDRNPHHGQSDRSSHHHHRHRNDSRERSGDSARHRDRNRDYTRSGSDSHSSLGSRGNDLSSRREQDRRHDHESRDPS